MATKSLTATIFGVDKASPVFDQVGKHAGEMAGDTEKASGRMSGAFQKGARLAAGALAAVGFAQFAKDTIQQASNMEQNIGAMQAVFGATSTAIEKFGATSASTVGIAKQDYFQLAAVFGSQLKNMGVATDELAPKTNQLVTLGADLAAVYGGTAADAVDAISSLLRGERDPIERYGVSIKQASINAYEMAHGLDTSTASAKTNSDMQATLALLFQQTADAQGQFASQTDTLAESQQIANAKFKEAQAEIGQKLLPVVTNLTNFASTTLVPILGDVADVLGVVMGAIDDIPGPVKIALAALIGFKMFQQTAVFEKMAAGIRSFKQEMAFASYSTDAGGKSMGRLGQAATVARGRLGGVAKMIGTGGLLAAGTAVVSSIVDQFSQLAENSERAESAAHSLADALVESGGAWDENARKAQQAQIEGMSSFDALIKAGVSYGDIMRGMTGDSDDFARLLREIGKIGGADLLFDVTDELAKMHTGLTTNAQDLAKQKIAYEKSTTAAKKMADVQVESQNRYVASLKASHAALGDQTAATVKQKNAWIEAQDKAQSQYLQIEELADVNRKLTAAAEDTSAKVRATAASMQEGYEKAHDLTSISSDLEAQLARLSGREPDVEDATRQFNGALQDLIDSAHDADGKLVRLGKSTVRTSGEINTGTKAGANLYDQVTKLAQAAQDTALAQAKLAGKTRGTKAAADAAAKSLAHSRSQFIKNAHQMGLTAEQARKLANRYFGIPKNIRTVVTGINNFTDVDQKIQRLKDTSITVDVTGSYRGTVGLPAHSSGGVNAGLASGGHARPGMSYLVGEEGPEILDMDPSGRGGWVTPHRQAMARLAAGVTLGRRAAGGPVGINDPLWSYTGVRVDGRPAPMQATRTSNYYITAPPGLDVAELALLIDRRTAFLEPL